MKTTYDESARDTEINGKYGPRTGQFTKRINQGKKNHLRKSEKVQTYRNKIGLDNNVQEMGKMGRCR